MPVNNFDERTIEENGETFSVQNQIQAYQSSDNLRANSLTSRSTSRNHRSRPRIRNYRNHGQDKVLKSSISLNK